MYIARRYRREPVRTSAVYLWGTNFAPAIRDIFPAFGRNGAGLGSPPPLR